VPVRRPRVCLAAVAAVSAAAALTTTARAQDPGEVVPVPDRSGEQRRAALRLARAIATDPDVIRRASFSALPPFANPAAISTKRLAGFPRHGSSFGILSSGSATRADDPNDTGDRSTSLGGPSVRGARDVTIMRMVLQVPRPARCLSVRFKFLSEEFPEWVNDAYNDAFIAELDTSSWTAGDKDDPTIKAPGNFAADARGNPIRVNAIGNTTVRPWRARGTTYDAATRILRASTRVTPGRHILYLSIFDQGDREFDSAVFVDRLTLDRRSPCTSGAVPD